MTDKKRVAIDGKTTFNSHKESYLKGRPPATPPGAVATSAACDSVQDNIDSTQATLDVLNGIPDPPQNIIDAIIYGEGYLDGLSSCHGTVC